jgi:catechol 2,3-dioxygenase-like lactoylglutathione lyase family enzyme
MAKIRHIAISVPDPWKAAEFYEEVMGLERVGETHSRYADGVYLSDGTVNLALLKYNSDEGAGAKGKDFVGAHHIGFWIEDFDAVKTKAEARGGKYWMGDPQTSYEVKFHDADGQIFDISLSGWPGTKRDVAGKPARKTAKTKAKTAKATA